MATASMPMLPGDVRMMNATAGLLAALGVASLLAVGALWLAKQPVFALRGIRIDGDVARNSVATIRANATPQLQGNFFSLDIQRAKAAFESVPWVRQAVVQRVFPNRLLVRLEEHQPAALWVDAEGREKLVNSFGEVFEANPGDVEDDGLPTLQGPDGSSARLLALWQQLRLVVQGLDARIDRLEMSGRGSLSAELDTGATLDIGRGSDEEVVERVRQLVATLPQVIAQHGRKLVHADLRHRDGYAVRLQGLSTTLTPEELKKRK